jgi:hypothetical protein
MPRKKPQTEPTKTCPGEAVAAQPADDGRYTVLRDTGEKLGWWFDPSERCAGTVERNLYTGDYSLEGYYDPKLFVVERKGAVTEFVANITQKEKWDDFKQELERLEEFRHPFVLCEFPLSLLKTYPRGSGVPQHLWSSIRITPQFLLKRLEEIWFRFKAKFVFTEGHELGREIVSGLFKRVVENVPRP